MQLQVRSWTNWTDIIMYIIYIYIYWQPWNVQNCVRMWIGGGGGGGGYGGGYYGGKGQMMPASLNDVWFVSCPDLQSIDKSYLSLESLVKVVMVVVVGAPLSSEVDLPVKENDSWRSTSPEDVRNAVVSQVNEVLRSLLHVPSCFMFLQVLWQGRRRRWLLLPGHHDLQDQSVSNTLSVQRWSIVIKSGYRTCFIFVPYLHC